MDYWEESGIEFFFTLFYFYLFIFGCVGSFFSCREQGLLFVAVHGLLVVVASPVGSTGSRRLGFSSCGSRALERRLSSCGARA